MTKVNSSAPSPKSKHQKRKSGKRHPGEPKKPYKDFPLFTVSSGNGKGRWAKKIRGKLYYFGPWDDPDAALKKYLDERDDLNAGRVPRSKATTGFALEDLALQFLTHKKNLLENGEIKRRTYDEFCATCTRLISTFGKGRLVTDLIAVDFEKLRADIAKAWGPVRLGNEIQRVRSVFKYGYDADLIDKPVRFGPAFKRPSLKVMRRLRAEKGKRMFQPEQIRAMLDAAGPQLRAMILLGVNVGYGNEDVATLPVDALDLDGGWATFPRPKTGVERARPKLWPETVHAIQNALACRPTPKNETHASLVFITKYGLPWSNETHGTALAHEMVKLLTKLSLKRPGLGFYALRHTFETIGGAAKDQVAVNHIMGHVDPSMADAYREEIGDDRLQAVAEHVRAWLYAEQRLRIADEGAAASA